MKQVLEFIFLLCILLTLNSCKQSTSKSSDTVETGSESVIDATDNILLEDTTELQQYDPDRKFSIKELTEVMDTLNSRMGETPMKYSTSAWALDEGKNRVVVYLINYNKENINKFRREVIDTPAILFVEVKINKPHHPVCDTCGFSMTVRPEVYKRPVTKINVVIDNKSKSKLMGGEDFFIEYSDNGSWYPVRLNYTFNSLGYIIEKNASRDFEINIQPEIYDYKPGKYKIYKTVSQDGEHYNLIAEFEIE
ncbi:MAG: hypothetical protein LBV43_03815 [Prevotella sp.]|nr:hypothetical protein [Prevotella sp.]